MADNPETVAPDEQPALTPVERIRQNIDQRQADLRFVVDANRRREEIAEAERRAQEERRGLWADGGLGVARGIPGFFEEAFDALASVDEWAIRTTGGMDFSAIFGEGRGKGFIITPSEGRELTAQGQMRSVIRTPEEGYRAILSLMPETERASGAIAEPMTKFLVGFVVARGALRRGNVLQGASAWSQFGNSMVAGAVSDALAFDAHEERLSNLLVSFDNPILNNAVTQYLAAEDTDGEIEGRIKSVLEGAGLGAMLEPFIAGLKAISKMRAAKKAVEAAEEARARTMPLPPERQAEEVVDVPSAVDELEVEDVRFPEADELDIDGNSILVTSRREAARTADEQADLDVALGPDERGKIEAMERGGEVLQVINVAVEPGARGTGLGRALYDKLISIADQKGLRFISDTSVSESAANLWRRLERDGHEIIDRTKTGEAELIDGQWQTSGGRPVFERVSGPVDEVTAAVRQAEGTNVRATVRAAFELTTDQREAFVRAVRDGDEETAERIMSDFNEATYDFSKIENGADIKEIMLETEAMFADLIDEVKGGVQSNIKTARLANLVRSTPEEVNRLFKDVRGDKGIAARFYAASRTMLASAANLREKVKFAKANPQDATAQAEALRAVQTHVAIQAEVKGAQTEIARALQAMSMIKDAASDSFREIEELIRHASPKGGGKTAWEKYMDDLLQAKSLEDLNARTSWTRWERMRNVIIEYTVNSMLSSLKTHVINFTSNVLNTVIYSFDRTLGGSWQYLAKGDKAAMREVRLDWVGKFSALDEAWKLAKQAWRDGAPVTDLRQRMEFQTRQAIGSDKTDANFFRSVKNRLTGGEQLANEGTFFQKFINTLGTTVRVPGRLLITGDEFFKAINRNAEMSVLAFRQADDEAVLAGFEYGSRKYEEFVERRMKKLLDPDNLDAENIEIRSRAIEKSRLVTFQEAPRTGIGSAAEQFINANWFVKLVVAPFFRTPMNILRQGAIDRTPLAYMVKSHQEILAKGGREAAELHARAWTGVAAMGAFYGLLTRSEEGDLGFEVVGKQPYDSSSRIQNINDYSIRIGDTWYQFNRLEPMGMWLGMVADWRTLAKYRQDEDAAMSMSSYLLYSFMNNVTNKTYMRTIADLQETLEGLTSGSEAAAARAVNRFKAGEFGKLIPQLYKATARALEDEDLNFRKEVWDFWEVMRDRSSTFQEGLAPRHDILGRKIDRDTGLSVLVNPFAAIEHSKDPVDEELFRLGIAVQPMRKTLGAEGIDLTAEEYSRMTGFMDEPLNTHRVLSELVTSDGWEDLPDPMKATLIKNVITENRAAARALILADESVLSRVRQEKINAALLLTPDGEE